MTSASRLNLMPLPPDPLSIYQQPGLRYHKSPGTPFDCSVPRYKVLSQTNSSSSLRNPESLEQFPVATALHKLNAFAQMIWNSLETMDPIINSTEVRSMDPPLPRSRTVSLLFERRLIQRQPQYIDSLLRILAGPINDLPHRQGTDLHLTRNRNSIHPATHLRAHHPHPSFNLYILETLVPA